MLRLRTIGLALSLAGLTILASNGGAAAQGKGSVGIAMPTKSSARWIDDGNNMVKALKERATRPTCNMPRTTFQTSSRRSRTW